MIKFSFNTSLSNILEDEYVLKTIRETLNDQVSISNNLIIIDSGFTFESNLNELIDEIDKRNKTRPSKSLSIEPTLLSQKILGNLTSNNNIYTLSNDSKVNFANIIPSILKRYNNVVIICVEVIRVKISIY